MNTFKFLNNVKKFKNRDYKDAINIYISKLTKNQDIISVYQLGSTDYPGLSDIDLIIVLRDSSNNFNWEKYSIKNLTKKERYLFMHEPFIVNRSIAENIKFLYPMFSLSHLYGEKIKFEEPSREHYLHFFIQEYVKGYMFWPDRILRKRKVNIRTIIPQLYATKYSIDIFKIIFNSLPSKIKKESEYYLKEVGELRNNFFELSQKEIEDLIVALILKTKKINELMFFELDNYLDKIVYNTKNITIYLGFFPIIILFNPKIKYMEYFMLRCLSPNFSVIFFNNFLKIRDKKIKKAFNERLNIINAYENFIYSKKLEKFMMLTNLKTKMAWNFSRVVKNAN